MEVSGICLPLPLVEGRGGKLLVRLRTAWMRLKRDALAAARLDLGDSHIRTSEKCKCCAQRHGLVVGMAELG